MKKIKNIVVLVSFISVIFSVLFAVRFLSDIVTVHYEEVKTVCLDAGHGGEDAGATLKSERIEKDDNLNLTLIISKKLNEKGVKTILTRVDDLTLDLKDRCKLANSKKCDLFVSVHRNSSISDGSGIEAWISQEQKHNESELANCIVSDLCSVSSLPNRGVMRGYRTNEANNYYVNANTNMPSILLEVGFVTNKNDNEQFDKNINIYAEKIADDIYKWLENNE